MLESAKTTGRMIFSLPSNPRIPPSISQSFLRTVRIRKESRGTYHSGATRTFRRPVQVASGGETVGCFVAPQSVKEMNSRWRRSVKKLPTFRGIKKEDYRRQCTLLAETLTVSFSQRSLLKNPGEEEPSLNLSQSMWGAFHFKIIWKTGMHPLALPGKSSLKVYIPILLAF